ncbi:cuticular protein RR-1 motif 53 precursor [Bombyx mori]|uniref:Putative cuticle protein n=1 Tax=Bombyx mori TaxID=7091 RepID=C0H6P5_BOMMO|nr:cuticular protein RR-1 motif 53 precursor [Bombyx mori]FAA00556.1 TPA: putative cuticle protein [Bombyx mori]
MLRLITLAVVCCSFAWGEPETLPVPEASPSTAPVVPVVSTPVPTYDPYYNNQYYNKGYYNEYNGVNVPILTYSSENAGDGTYSFSFTTGDGKQVQENGFLKDTYVDNAGEPQGTQVVQGSYSYVAPDGTPVQVSYVADENGFRPTGPHIPSDGKAPVVAPVVVDKVNAVYEPNYNRYNPTDYRNQYNNQFGQYNRPYNTRYPYDSRNPYNSGRYNPYNNYNNQYYNNFNPFSTAVPSTIQPKSESS